MGRKRQPIKHGTYAGARAHRARGIPLCEPCKAAERAYSLERNRKIAAGEHTPVKRAPVQCGTNQGYARHYRNGEPACKACRAAHAEYVRKYRQEHPEYVEQCRNDDKEYAKRPEVRKRVYARQAVEQVTPGTPRYYRVRARILRRDAARRGADVSHGVSTQGLANKMAMWGGKCWVCGHELDTDNLTFDHVKPLSKGGLDILANIRPCCRSCNCRKGNTWPLAELEAHHV